MPKVFRPDYESTNYCNSHRSVLQEGAAIQIGLLNPSVIICKGVELVFLWPARSTKPEVQCAKLG